MDLGSERAINNGNQRPHTNEKMKKLQFGGPPNNLAANKRVEVDALSLGFVKVAAADARVPE